MPLVHNEKTGKEYYQGGFDQYSTFFVALCRAVGIPARCITEISGWGPWMTQENIRPSSKADFKICFEDDAL
ncbi:MAG: transglutaminase domain-containing protein [Planctomycetes bacterium]|nr:transglutaminase domain-containing protein [Planctomycetota bacterium]